MLPPGSVKISSFIGLIRAAIHYLLHLPIFCLFVSSRSFQFQIRDNLSSLSALPCLFPTVCSTCILLVSKSSLHLIFICFPTFGVLSYSLMLIGLECRAFDHLLLVLLTLRCILVSLFLYQSLHFLLSSQGVIKYCSLDLYNVCLMFTHHSIYSSLSLVLFLLFKHFCW